jgi:predicted nucleotidyltransferase component of viral defense system
MAIDITIHKNVLLSILKDIFTNPKISPYLGFKGGTAALLFHDLSRFSVDLDFDLLDANKEDELFNTIKNVLEPYGNVKAQKKRYSLFFLLSYKNKLENAQNIKIEINKRSFGSKYEIKQYLGIPMRVMEKKDIIAHKLVAMYERMGKTNRDIFDVYFFLHNNWPVNKQIIEQRTNLSYKAFLKKCINNLEKMSNQNILSGLGELLNAKQKNWVKTRLKDETIFLLKREMSNEA